MGAIPLPLNIEYMKKIMIVMALLASAVCYGQDKLPDKIQQDTVALKEGVYVHRAGTRYSRKTYTEIYEVITDSVVNRFGLEFRSDSTFLRRVPMEGTTRKLYDRMKSDADFVASNQERLHKETIEVINSYRTSYEVWAYFKLLGIFGR